MKIDKVLILLSVVFVVFLAGCTKGGSEGPAGAGVIITSFAPDVQTVDAGSSVSFVVGVKNIGERAASDVKALLFGLSSDWSPAPTLKTIGTLAPVDPATGLKGEEGTTDWAVTAPVQAKSTDITYDASVRVFYKTTTISDSVLRFVTSDYLKTNPNTPKGVQSSTTTGGSFLVTTSARTPTVSGAIGRVQFEIQNVGGGRVYKSVDDAGKITDLDIITKITVTGLGPAGTCNGGTGAGTVTIESVRLAGGKSKVISCNVDVGATANFKDAAITMILEYNYFVDSATAVTVTKGLEVTPGDFSISLESNSVDVTVPAAGAPANTKDVKITLRSIQGFADKITLTKTETPALVGATATLAPMSGGVSSIVLAADATDATGKITIAVPPGTTAATYKIKVIATSSVGTGSLIRESPVLTVNVKT